MSHFGLSVHTIILLGRSQSVQSSRAIPLGESVSALDLCCPPETDAGSTWPCNSDASVDKWTDGTG